MEKNPNRIYIHSNKLFLEALRDACHILLLSAEPPTPFKELVTGWPQYIGVKDSLSHRVGGIIIGKEKACVPTVFRLAWPEDIKEAYQSGKLTNYDLDMAGLLLMWLVIEAILHSLKAAYVDLFSDTLPTVGWVKRLAARGSHVAMQFLSELLFRIKENGTSPLTPLHIPGEENQMTNTPSW